MFARSVVLFSSVAVMNLLASSVSSLLVFSCYSWFFFFFQAEDGIRDLIVTGVQTCALPISTYAADPRHGASVDRYLSRHGVGLQRKSPGLQSGRDEDVGRREVGVGAAAEIGRASCRERV